MQNPIPYTGFFATPDSYTDLIEYLEQFNGSERAVAMTAACMALNLAHRLVEQQHVAEGV